MSVIKTNKKNRHLDILFALQKIETPRELREQNRDCETHITAKKRNARPVKFDEKFARPVVFEGPDSPPLN